MLPRLVGRLQQRLELLFLLSLHVGFLPGRVKIFALFLGPYVNYTAFNVN